MRSNSKFGSHFQRHRTGMVIMNKEIKYLNQDVLSDIQMLEIKTLYLGLHKHINEVLKHCFSGEYFDKWEMVLLEERLAEMIKCLGDVTDNVVEVSQHITVNNKNIFASLSENKYETADEWNNRNRIS